MRDNLLGEQTENKKAWKESFNNPEILDMMKKLSFEVDEELDKKFPAQRICRAEITTKDGKVYISRDFEPSGEAHENIGIDWLSEKFCRITEPVITKDAQKQILEILTSDENTPVRSIVDLVNTKSFWKF